jgi:hypothetical protein
MEMLGSRARDRSRGAPHTFLALAVLGPLPMTSCGQAVAADQQRSNTVELLPLGTLAMGEQHDSTFWVKRGYVLA